MAIGDNWNDREMLAFAGLPVVWQCLAGFETSGKNICKFGALASYSSNDEGGWRGYPKLLLG